MYEKIKKVTVWIPILGWLLVVFFEKNKNKSMYDEYFQWGGVWLVPISALWHGVVIFIIMLILSI